MKKIRIIFVCLSPLSAYSQNSLSVGPLGGVNVNFYTGAALIDHKTGYGPAVGAFIESMSVPKWGFLGRILYDDKSGSFTSEDTNSAGLLQHNDNKIKLSYLSIDALMEYRFPI